MLSREAGVPLTDDSAALLRRRVLRPVDALFIVLAIACAIAAAYRLAIPSWLQYLPFALSLVFFGLPHGALDHLVPARLAGTRPTAASVGAVVLLYLVLATGVLTLWFATPALAFGFFIAVTWFHWGQGDLFVLLALDDATNLRGRLSRILAIVVRGGLPMLVPLCAHPDAYADVMREATGVFGHGPSGSAYLFESGFRLTVGALFAVVTVFSLVLGRVRASTPLARRAWRRDSAETLILAVFFVVVPPVLAIGLYFCLWHALRHIIRLQLLDPNSRTAIERGALVPAVLRFGRDAAPVTAIALAILVVFALLVPHPAHGAGPLLGIYLVLISALTLPHVVIVSYMDRRQLGRPRPRQSAER